MTIKRWWLPAALAITLGVAGWTVLASRDRERQERVQEEAFERRLGDALIRQGITLYQKGEYSAAIAAWERYVRAAPPNADTQSIREMIGEARAAAEMRSKHQSWVAKPTQIGGFHPDVLQAITQGRMMAVRGTAEVEK